MAMHGDGSVATSISSAAFPLLAPDGTAAAPSYSFASEASGLFLRSAGLLGFSTAGTQRAELASSYFRVGSGLSIGWSSAAAATSSTDTTLTRNAAGILDLHNTTSTSAQFNVWNTRTSASVGEWLEASWSGNIAVLRTNSAGGGTTRVLNIRYGGSSAAAISVGTGIASGITIVNGATSSVGYGVQFNHALTATSGTSQILLFPTTSGAQPTGTSTLDWRCIDIASTINYSNGTPGAGRIQLIRLAPTLTASPTGNNGAIVLSSTAGTYGSWLFNTSDETTNWEALRLYTSSNVYLFQSVIGGSGTMRNIAADIGAADGSAVFVHQGTSTITGGVTDGYTGSLRLTPTYNAATAQTVTRHDYFDLNDVTVGGAGPAAVTNACVFRFNAAAGTHKAVDSGTTKTTPGTVDAWAKVNINGTLYYIPAYTSKTS